MRFGSLRSLGGFDEARAAITLTGSALFHAPEIDGRKGRKPGWATVFGRRFAGVAVTFSPDITEV